MTRGEKPWVGGSGGPEDWRVEQPLAGAAGVGVGVGDGVLNLKLVDISQIQNRPLPCSRGWLVARLVPGLAAWPLAAGSCEGSAGSRV